MSIMAKTLFSGDLRLPVDYEAGVAVTDLTLEFLTDFKDIIFCICYAIILFPDIYVLDDNSPRT